MLELPIIQSSGEVLPPLYARWAKEFLSRPLMPETEADCGNCPMVESEDDTQIVGRAFFSSTTKCCTYHPSLPSFLVGSILSDSATEQTPGRVAIEKRLERRIGVTPLGIMRPKLNTLEYAHGAKLGFGNAERLRCPYLFDGGCGIWQHRGAICSTWFCKHHRGAAGAKAWDEVRLLLGTVEHALTRWCLLDGDASAFGAVLGKPTHEHESGLSELNAADLDGTVDAAQFAAQWGTWLGREREWFERCAQKVSELAWADVLAICGPETDIRLQITQRALASLHEEPRTQRLRVGSFNCQPLTVDSYRVTSYRDFDALELPADLIRALPMFNGQPTAVVRAALLEEHGVEIEDETLAMLIDFEVLVPVE